MDIAAVLSALASMESTPSDTTTFVSFLMSMMVQHDDDTSHNHNPIIGGNGPTTSSSNVRGAITQPEIVSILMKLMPSLDRPQRGHMLKTLQELCSCPQNGFINKNVCSAANCASSLLNAFLSSDEGSGVDNGELDNVFAFVGSLLVLSCDPAAVRCIGANLMKTHLPHHISALVNLLHRTFTAHSLNTMPKTFLSFPGYGEGDGMEATVITPWPGNGITIHMEIRISTLPLNVGTAAAGTASTGRTLLSFTAGESGKEFQLFSINVVPVSATSFAFLYTTRKDHKPTSASTSVLVSSVPLEFEKWHTVAFSWQYQWISVSQITLLVGGVIANVATMKYPPAMFGKFKFGVASLSTHPLPFQLTQVSVFKDIIDKDILFPKLVWGENMYQKLLFSLDANRIQHKFAKDIALDTRSSRGNVVDFVIKGPFLHLCIQPFLDSAVSVGDYRTWLSVLEHVCREGAPDTAALTIKITLHILVHDFRSATWLRDEGGCEKIAGLLSSMPHGTMTSELTQSILAFRSHPDVQLELKKQFYTHILANFVIWAKADSSVQQIVVSTIVDDMTDEGTLLWYAQYIPWRSVFDSALVCWRTKEVATPIVAMMTHVISKLAENQNSTLQYFIQLLTLSAMNIDSSFPQSTVSTIMNSVMTMMKTNPKLGDDSTVLQLLYVTSKTNDPMLFHTVLTCLAMAPRTNFSFLTAQLTSFGFVRKIVDTILQLAMTRSVPVLLQLLFIYVNPIITTESSNRVFILESIRGVFLQTPGIVQDLLQEWPSPLWISYACGLIPSNDTEDQIDATTRTELFNISADICGMFLASSLPLVAERKGIREVFKIFTSQGHRKRILTSVLERMRHMKSVPPLAFNEVCQHVVMLCDTDSSIITMTTEVLRKLTIAKDINMFDVATLELREVHGHMKKLEELTTKLDTYTRLLDNAKDVFFDQLRNYVKEKKTSTANAISQTTHLIGACLTNYGKRVSDLALAHPELSAQHISFYLVELVETHQKLHFLEKDYEQLLRQILVKNFAVLKELRSAFCNQPHSGVYDNEEVEMTLLLSSILDNRTDSNWWGTFKHGWEVSKAVQVSVREPPESATTQSHSLTATELLTLRHNNMTTRTSVAQAKIENIVNECEQALFEKESVRWGQYIETSERTRNRLAKQWAKMVSGGEDAFVNYLWSDDQLWKLDSFTSLNTMQLRYRVRRSTKGLTAANAVSPKSFRSKNVELSNNDEISEAVQKYHLATNDAETEDLVSETEGARSSFASTPGAAGRRKSVASDAGGMLSLSPVTDPHTPQHGSDVSESGGGGGSGNRVDLVSSKNYSVECDAKKEAAILSVPVDLITVAAVHSGYMHIHPTCVYFISSRSSSQTLPHDYKIGIKDITSLSPKRHCLHNNSVEIYVETPTAAFHLFFAFASTDILEKASGIIASQQEAQSLRWITTKRTPAKIFASSTKTQEWIHRKITNFEYLMFLNSTANRTLSDVNQYPVFPWVLNAYGGTAQTLDLSDPSSYRDFSKPIGAQDPSQAAKFTQRYNEFDPSGSIPKFHYGTHYSNGAGVMYYLVRLKPFSDILWKLQGNCWDVPDRMFHSIAEAFFNVTHNSADVKELVPEFFYLPECLMNVNRFQFGVRTDGVELDDVVLPSWAANAHEFISIHREALESEYVSQHLHEWIDLIFGYKQRGVEAEKAINVFYFLTYDGAVKWETITDELERHSLQEQICCFGQCPSQLLTKPHPSRGLITTGTSLNKPNPSYISPKMSSYVQFNFTASNCVVWMSVVDGILHAILDNWSMYVFKVNVSQGGLDSAQPKVLPIGVYPRTCDAIVLSNNFSFHPQLRVLCVGMWRDNHIFKLFQITTNKIGTRMMGEYSTVVAMSPCAKHLACVGLISNTVRIFALKNSAKSSVYLHTLRGHDAPIHSVLVNSELDVVVTGGQDPFILIFSLRKGKLVRRVSHTAGHTNKLLGLFSYPQMTFVTCSTYTVTCYAINGTHVMWTQSFPDPITATFSDVAKNIIGVSSGKLVLLISVERTPKAICTLEIPATCTSLHLEVDSNTLLVGCSNGFLYSYMLC
eukprot:PhF_6_TR25510/c0_g1_i1/m.35592